MGELNRGLFITFEGIDGIGKTTAAKEFTKWLNVTGHNSYFCKTPGEIIDGHLVGSSIGPAVRDIIFTDKHEDMSYEVKSLLILADHIHLTQSFILPTIKVGMNVISDRYMDSQLAYWNRQDTDILQGLYRNMYEVKPDITFLFIGNPIHCLDRALHRSVSDSKKQVHKPWNTVEDLTRIQEAYITELMPQSRTIPILVHGQDIIQVSNKIQRAFTQWQERRVASTKESVSQ